LYLWRTGVGLMGLVLLDYVLLCVGRQCHSWIDTPRLLNLFARM
jgi:hypothetical protein